jgi:hypothetical protein
MAEGRLTLAERSRSWLPFDELGCNDSHVDSGGSGGGGSGGGGSRGLCWSTPCCLGRHQIHFSQTRVLNE